MNFYVLWLISLEINDIEKINLLNTYKDEKVIYDNFFNILPNIKMKKSFDFNDVDRKVKALENKLRQNEIKVVTIKDREYPKKLQLMEDRPYCLFYKGDISLTEKFSLGVVGGRKHTIYGERVTRFVVKSASLNDIVIVSGGAMGIDSIAHKETLLNNGKTIVVLGCGIDVVYPKINRELFKEVAKKGLIISEFLPGTEPYSYNFPKRNRIISGLSDKIIVSEAGMKSGSLITVNYALEQGKDIGTIPGSIFSELSIGSNMLLRDGAAILVSKEDLLYFLNIDKSKEASISIIQNEILNIIKDEPMHIDKIFEKAQVDRNTLYRLLFEMQIENKIVSLPGNYYARII